MKCKYLLLTLTLVWNLAPLAQAQSTAFTYQGRLTANASSANGLYDLSFSLFDTSSGGALISGPLTSMGVVVSNGLFNATLDFGSYSFPGADRWLEVAVRPHNGSSFTTLSPRQHITPAPYAIMAASLPDHAVTAAQLADRSVTASKLSPAPGANGQVLKLNGGTLTWGTDLNSGGTVSSVSAGAGLAGGPVTTSGTLAIDTNVVPRLSAGNTFSGPNTFGNSANSFVGTFAGNGAGLTNVNVSATNVSVTLGGDVSGPSANSTVARIRGVTVVSNAPVASQHLRYNGTNWTPAAVALNTDVSGTLALANGGTGGTTGPTARANLGAAASGPNADISSLSGLTTPLSTAQGGTGANTPGGARASLGAAANGANADITSLGGLQTIVVRATNGQSGDLQEWQNSSGTVLASVSTAGVLNGNGAGLTNVATTIADGSVTAAKLSPGPGANGQVLRMQGNQLAWGSAGSGTVTSVGSGSGLTGGPITSSGTLAIDPTVVPLLGAANTFTASNSFANGANNFAGNFSGNGTGLTNVTATTVVNGAITAVKLSSGAGLNGQVLKMSGGVLSWGTDFNSGGTVTSVGTGSGLSGGPITGAGTLSIDPTVVPQLGAANTFSGSNTFNGVSSFGNAANNFVGTYTGNGAGLTNVTAATVANGSISAVKLSPGAGLNGQVLKMSGGVLSWGTDFNSGGTVTSVGTGSGLTGGPITGAGTLSIDPSVVPQLGAANTFSGSNTFNGVSSFGNAANSFVGTFSGNGAGLTNVGGTGPLSGDVTGTPAATTVARIRGVNVATSAPVASQHLRFDGANWTPAAVALNSDVSGTLALANGGTGGTTASGARANLSAAASGANADITSLGGLTTPLSTGQGGTGANTPAGARASLAAAVSGANTDITSLSGLTTPLSTAQGGTGASTPAGARTSLGAAASGANADITSLSGLSTPLSTGQGGTGANTPAGARASIGAAASGANGDITSLSGLTTALSTAQGGTGANTPSGARTSLGAAASGANADITSLSALQTLAVRATNGQSGDLQDWLNPAGVVLVSISASGVLSGNGAGLTNVSGTGPLAGDVTGTPSATTVARIRGVNVATTAPAASQHLRFDGANWTPAAVALNSDVSGTLAVANGGTGGTTASGARANLGAAASGANGDITSLSGLTTPLSTAQGGTGANTPSGARTGIGAAASGANSDITSLSGLTTPLSTAQGGTGANTPSGARTGIGAAASGPNADITSLASLQTLVVRATNGQSAHLQDWQNSAGAIVASVSTAGVISGNGSGLTNLFVTASNITVTLNGDVTGPGLTNTLARIRGAALATNAPVANQLLRYNGANWAPSAVALGSDVAGTLAVGNGGTGGTTASGARANLGAAASGANADITSLSGLTTPLSAAQGGSGQSSYSPGDVLYGAAGNTLVRLPAGAAGQTLSITNNALAWAPANAHNHIGQVWSGAIAGSDAFNVRNTADVDGSSAITGISTGPTSLSYGVFGQSSSTNGVAVQGLALASGGFPVGVGGESGAFYGSGVYGLASSLTGPPTGVFGEAYSTNGIGVYGLGSATSGVPVGVYGETDAPLGYGLYTPNRLFVGNLSFFEGNVFMIPPARLYVDGGIGNTPGLTIYESPDVGLISPATNVLGITTTGAERLRVDGNGLVGIGRVPATNILEIAGDASKAVAGGWSANSDARIKTHVQSLTNALQTIESVRPVSFHYTDTYRQSHPGIEDKAYCNVIAQEFARVFPDSVKDSGEKLDGKPILQVDTYPATMYSIAAIQELHELIKAKDAELEQMKRHQAALERRLQALEQQAGLVSQAQRVSESP